jgi:hypothetical protein
LFHKQKETKDKANTPPPKQRPMHDVDDLLDEAKCGKLTSEEILYVGEQVKASRPGDNTDLYGLLFILGLSEATQYRELVEGFLYYPTDPMVSGMTLKVLFRYWGNDVQRYLNELKAFIKGVPWDESENLRLAAVQCTGDFLKETPEKELFQILLDLYETSNDIFVQAGRDKTSESRRAKFWLEVAFTQLARSVGKWDQLFEPPEQATLSDQEFVLGILEEVEQIIKNLK